MLKRLRVILVVLILTWMMAIVACTSDSQDSVAPVDFYRGNTINLIISSSPGGITDLISRVIAPYLERDTGANVVVTNRSGAGGLEGMNYLYRSKPDGLTLGTTSSGRFIPNKVLDEPAAAYEIDEFSYIMTIGNRLSYFMVSPDGPFQSIAELKSGINMKIGASSPSGTVSLGGMTVCELLDLDARVVTGLGGEPERALAVKRGETAGYAITLETAKANIDSGMVKPILVLATERDPRMPEIPAVTELGNMSEEDIQLAELWETALAGSIILAAPPSMPQDRLTFLRDLADKWTRYEEFREDINLVCGYNVDEYDIGNSVDEIMFNLTNSLDKFRAIFTELIEKYRA